MQNLVAVFHTVCTYVGSHKNFRGRWVPAPWDEASDSQETCYYPHVLSYQISLL